jgi:two-component system response regulator MprA
MQTEIMRILVVEDDVRMAGLLERGLGEEGYQVAVARDGAEGLGMARAAEFDLILLDVMMPGIDGLEVVRRLRDAGARTPVLMLTARDSCADIVAGLDLGADDYLTKPFAFEELLARVRAAARRGPAARSVVLRAGRVSLNTSSREARVDGVPVALTRTEYLILELLMRRAGHVVPREAIIEEVWGYDREVENNTLDAFMKMLRAKVDTSPAERLIRTVRGVGYIVQGEGE